MQRIKYLRIHHPQGSLQFPAQMLGKSNMKQVILKQRQLELKRQPMDQSPASEAKEQTASSSMRPMPKRTPLTAREKLRAARVLGKYTEAKLSKSNLGSKVLDAMRESDGGKARSGLPEAPTNLFDDSKRGLPKEGWTCNFPGGNDLLIIIFSFVFISTVMFTTTYIVWKAGAIHFNEY